MLRHRLSLNVLLAAVCLGGCQVEEETCPDRIDVDDFDRSCTADAQCVPVYEGPGEEYCCFNAAISADALDDYEAATAACRDLCSAADCGGKAVCGAGRCRFEP